MSSDESANAAENPTPETPTEAVLLLLDESEEDRAQLLEQLSGLSVRTHAVASTDEARALVETLDRLDIYIAGIPEAEGKSVFDLHEELAARFGPVATAYCSASDMSSYYPLVHRGEMLFFKPIDDAVLREWLSKAAGVDFTEPASTPPETAASAGEELPETTLPPGTVLGDYRIGKLIQHDEHFAMYEAEQTSIGRRVALKTLFRQWRRDPEWVGLFAHEARARALVSHPDISLVYEAAQERGVNYYTLELVDGPTLGELARSHTGLDDATLWRVLKVIAGVLNYLKANKMAHRALSADTIFLVNSGHPRVANPVKYGEPIEDFSTQMVRIAEAIRPFLKGPARPDPRLVALVERLDPHRIDAIRTPHGLEEAIRHLEDEALQPEAPEQIEQRTNRTALIVGGFAVALIAFGLLIARFLVGGGSEARDLDGMVLIPSGAFVYQDGEKIELPAYWIGEYEVTIADYAKFLADLAAHPEKAGVLRHPDQPDIKTTYRPPDWDEIYAAAKKGRKFSGMPLDLNCPAIQVDWWDAHAYAAWKGHRLPTEEEWEKAARGREGAQFPWGDELDLKKFNSGAEDAESGSDTADGRRYCGPVDAFPEDVSKYGVGGLAGNVSEWTATWSTGPDNPDQKFPIKRGASFATKEGFQLTARRPAKSAGEATLWTGFRTASDQDPARLPDPAAATAPQPAAQPKAEGGETPPPAPEPAPTPAPEPKPAEGNATPASAAAEPAAPPATPSANPAPDQ